MIFLDLLDVEVEGVEMADLDPFYWSQRTWKLSSLLVQR